MTTTIGEAVEHTIGGGWGSETPSEAGDVAVRIIRGADFPAAELRNVSSMPIRYEPAMKVAKRTLQAGDIVLETSGGTKDRPTGRTVLVTESMMTDSSEPLIPASFCRLIRIDTERANPAFVYHALQDLYARGGTWEFQNSSTGISNFQFDLFQRSYRLPDFTLNEQQAMAEVLGALDDKIAANTALAATAEQLLRSEIDSAWLTGHDRSSVLSDFVDLNPRIGMPLAETAIYVDMKRLPESGWSIDGFDYREPKGGARFQNGDTLLARITPCLENRKTGFVDHLPAGEIGVGSTEFIVMRAREGVASPISFLLATAPRFRDHAIQHMAGTSGRQRVAATDLGAFELPTPGLAWLRAFGARAEAVFSLVRSQSAENRTLAATRSALLPQLMSGKLRVRDAEKLLAAASA